MSDLGRKLRHLPLPAWKAGDGPWGITEGRARDYGRGAAAGVGSEMVPRDLKVLREEGRQQTAQQSSGPEGSFLEPVPS